MILRKLLRSLFLRRSLPFDELQSEIKNPQNINKNFITIGRIYIWGGDLSDSGKYCLKMSYPHKHNDGSYGVDFYLFDEETGRKIGRKDGYQFNFERDVDTKLWCLSFKERNYENKLKKKISNLEKESISKDNEPFPAAYEISLTGFELLILYTNEVVNLLQFIMFLPLVLTNFYLIVKAKIFIGLFAPKTCKLCLRNFDCKQEGFLDIGLNKSKIEFCPWGKIKSNT